MNLHFNLPLISLLLHIIAYSVLVVGAGPAGSSAAYHLARQGADVLLVDRFAFPRDKRCGDGIVTAALEELALMGIADEVQAHPLPGN